MHILTSSLIYMWRSLSIIHNLYLTNREPTFSNLKAITSNPFMVDLEKLQQTLSDIDDENYEQSKVLIADSFTSNDRTPTLARNLIKFSCIRPTKVELYLKLIEDLANSCNLLEEIDNKSESKYCDLIYKLSERKMIKYRDLEPNINLSRAKLYKIIRNDDLDSFQTICSAPGFDFDSRLLQFAEYVEFQDDIRNLGDKSDMVVPFMFFSAFEIIPTLIGYCAYCGAIKCFKYLLLCNAEKNSNLFTSSTMIECAIAGGNCEIIHLMEQNGATINKNCVEIAAEYQHFDIFDWLVEKLEYSSKWFLTSVNSFFVHGINQSQYGDVQMALDQAASKYYDEFFSIFIDNYDLDLNYLLKACILKHDRQMVKKIIEKPEIDIYKCHPLILACKVSDLEIVKMLLNLPEVDINEKDGDHSALKYSIENGNLEIFKLLIDHPDIEVNEFTIDHEGDLDISYNILATHKPLEVACKMGKLEMLKILLQMPEIDCSISALFYAIKYNHLKCVKLLLEQPAIDVNETINCDIDMRSYSFASDITVDYEITPLIAACYQAKSKIVRALLETKGIDINRRGVLFIFIFLL